MQGWCKVQGKQMFATRHDAQKTIAGSKARTKFRDPLTTYRCPHCGHYHITKITHFKAGKKKNTKGKHR